MELDLPSFLKNPFTRNVSDPYQKDFRYLYFFYILNINIKIFDP